MEPIDAITDIEELTFKNYISIYGGTECGPLNLVLKEWNKNKRTLFKALGKKLKVSKMVTIPKSDNVIYSELESIYHPYIIWQDVDKITARDHIDDLKKITNNDFICDVIHFWVNQNYSNQELFILTRLFLHRNFSKGYISILDVESSYHFQSFKCTIKNGMKTIRTIQKVLKATQYPNLELFEKWRNQISLVQTENEIKAKLVISIDPIDFISMSDNRCNWRSCMSWENSGCYNAGTLEMMNSNIAAVAYLEADSPFELYLNDTGEVYNVPNKSWRSLIFIHKDIILLGKQYPFYNDFLIKVTLDTVRNLVQKNLNWKYQFINQEYRDMNKVDGNFYVRDWFNLDYDRSKKHHSIFVYTNGMYNDIIEAKSPVYYCCRNYVAHSKKICLSGPATCICCGEKLTDRPREEIYGYDDLGQDKICYKCKLERRCKICGNIHYNNKYYTKIGTFCSDQCLHNSIIFPNRNHQICLKDNLQFTSGSKICLFVDEKLDPQDWEKISQSFVKTTYNDINNWFYQWKNYKDIRLYKVPRELCGYRFADIACFSSSLCETNQDYSCNLLFYFNISDKYKRIEERIQNLKEYIPLKEYLVLKGYMEGGEDEDENSFTLTS